MQSKKRKDRRGKGRGTDGQMRAAIYIRVSTDDQVEGNSLTTQEEACRQLAAKRGWEIVSVYNDDGYSGATLDRPELKHLLDDASDGVFDVVCVWRFDRLSRKTRDFLNLLADLEEEDIHFVSATQDIDTTTIMGKAIVTFIALVAEMERENIIARVKPNMKRGAQNGDWQGGQAPFGYELVKGKKSEDGQRLEGSKLRIIPEQAAIVRRIPELCLEGYGVRRIALTLNKEGKFKPGGSRWSSTHIHKILTSRVYVGDLVWNRTQPHSRRLNEREEWVVVENHHEAIIDVEIYEAVQHTLKERNASHVTCNLGSPYMLTGVLYCAKCGTKMIGANRRVNNRTKQRRRSYRCGAAHSGRDDCPTNSIDAELAEQAIVKIVSDVARQPGILHEVKHHVERLIASSANPARSDELKELRAKLAEIQRRRRTLLDLLLCEGQDDPLARRRYEELGMEGELLEKAIHKLETRLYNAGAHEIKVSDALVLMENFDVVWQALTIEERKQTLKAVCERVEANDGHLVCVQPTQEFAPFLPALEAPIRCLTWQRNVKALNMELRTLRGEKSLRQFARELGMSETYLGEIERGKKAMSDFVQGKISDWQSRQGECVG